MHRIPSVRLNRLSRLLRNVLLSSTMASLIIRYKVVKVWVVFQ
jgi:hypothetical protein